MSNTGLWFACYDCNNTEISQILQKQPPRIATGHLGWNAVVTPSSWMGLVNLMITKFRSAKSEINTHFFSEGQISNSNISMNWVIFSTNTVQNECSVGKYCNQNSVEGSCDYSLFQCMVLLSRRILRGYLLFMHFTNYLLSMLFPSGGFFSNIKKCILF